MPATIISHYLASSAFKIRQTLLRLNKGRLVIFSNSQFFCFFDFKIDY